MPGGRALIDPETVLERALRAIEASARPGRIVRSGHVAAGLLQEYPDFEMSAAELSKTIFELASAKGFPVEFGD